MSVRNEWTDWEEGGPVPKDFRDEAEHIYPVLMDQGDDMGKSNMPDVSDPIKVYNEIHRRLERLELIVVAQSVGNTKIAEKHIDAIKQEVKEHLRS